jgi:glycosyltransferase involved in cell wall biosynthesis
LVKKRIAIWLHGGVGSGLYSQGQPAIHKLITDLAEQYEIDVYTKSPPADDFKPSGFRIFSLKKDFRSGILRWAYLIILFFRNHKRKRYDLLYGFWGYPAGVLVVILAKILNRPSTIHLQGGDSVSLPVLRYGVFYHPLRRSICLWAYQKCTCLIALTDYQVKFLREFGVSRVVDIIPFGVDTALFQFEPERFQHPALRCLHVANQTPVKDQETMLRAFAFILGRNSAFLKIIGADFYNGQLKKLCTELGIEKNVSFLGAKAYTDMVPYYHESDILLHTSLYEGQGLVFAEAAACGTLIAGTRVGMLADMGDECGIIVSVGQAQELADKISVTLQRPAAIKKMQEAARKWSTSRNVEYTLAQLSTRINQLLLR